jgi:hypothetical protein
MANVFIFQTIDPNDLAKRLIVGRRDTWYATRYRGVMQIDDVVFFWMGGDPALRGLYAWGHLVSPPYTTKDGSPGVDVKYEYKFDEPVLAGKIRKEPILAGMLLFRAPQATNFLLTPEEASQLRKLLDSRGLPSPTLEAAA